MRVIINVNGEIEMKGYAVTYTVYDHRSILDVYASKQQADDTIKTILDEPNGVRKKWLENPRIKEVEIPSIISSTEGYEDTPIGPVAYRETLIAAQDQYQAEEVFVREFNGHQYSSISGTGEPNSLLYTIISD